jgi:hypothetical protein
LADGLETLPASYVFGFCWGGFAFEVEGLKSFMDFLPIFHASKGNARIGSSARNTVCLLNVRFCWGLVRFGSEVA